MNKVSRSIVVLVLAISSANQAWAQETESDAGPAIEPVSWFAPSGSVVDTPYGRGYSYADTDETFPSRCLTLQVLGGFYFSPLGGSDENHPRFHYSPTILRLGGLFDSPIGPEGSCGRLEPLLELQGSYVFNGPGRWFYGPSGLLRYNFAAPDWRIIPYLQGGVGVVFSSDNELIRRVGELIVQGGLGCRWWVNTNWSVDLEVQYNRITGRGDGVDALGGSLGATYYFPRFSR